MFNKLLDQGVIIRPLKSNEMPDYVRVSLGTKEEMDHYYEAMEKILPEYDKKFGRPSWCRYQLKNSSSSPRLGIIDDQSSAIIDPNCFSN